MILSLLSGLASGLSLIVAIGAQNAFVLRQGVQRSHVLLVVAVCALSDLVLIVLGVAGVGVLIEQAPGVLGVVRWAGAAFLLAYGLMAARRAIRGTQASQLSTGRQGTWAAALGTCLALTWLNPHVYLDTVLLLGSVANQQAQDLRWWFGAGAITASLAWFSALGFGARALRSFFARPASWRILDGLVAVVMLTLGIRLAVGS